jgi:hypothetical protein
MGFFISTGKYMKSVGLEINGRMNTINSDGSISWVHGQTGNIVTSFGYVHHTGYSKIKIGGKSLSVHRIIARAFICSYSESLQVDHIDGNRANNRAENLRMTSKSENLRGFNKSCVGMSSKYRGVYLDKRSRRWKGEVRCNQKKKHIGYFATELEAALAWDKAASAAGYFPEALNFP